MIVLIVEFYQEITAHPTPRDLDAVRVLASAPAVLDLFMCLSYRCFIAKGVDVTPIFGPYGLAAQLENVEYARPRRFREELEPWLRTIRSMWPNALPFLGAMKRLSWSAEPSIFDASPYDDRAAHLRDAQLRMFANAGTRRWRRTKLTEYMVRDRMRGPVYSRMR